LLNARPELHSSGSNRVIDEHAVILTKEHFESESMGYGVEDVGQRSPTTGMPSRPGSVVKVEVKGMTSNGSEIVTF
jgi:hypothetical protein